jgi:hypothetical protein
MADNTFAVGDYVKCVRGGHNLAEGAEYDVRMVGRKLVAVTNDSGEDFWYDPERFVKETD